jgi:hypothetical protein
MVIGRHTKAGLQHSRVHVCCTDAITDEADPQLIKEIHDLTLLPPGQHCICAPQAISLLIAQ